MAMWTLGLVGGLALWTLLEYVLHRFVFHDRVAGPRAAKEHILHHAKVDYFSPLGMKLALALPILGAIVTIASLLLGWRLGSSIPTGVIAGWWTYEVIHRRIHVAAPFGAYGRWARRHHLLHHFGRSDANHGVTSPVWDWVFGTLAAPETVRVPRQHAKKFPWLLDRESEAPAVAPAFAADYRIG
jgi:sterol desaturase/sphingolipid hydroxylase (fatty acid hydroxylase superfamily)